MIAFLLAILSSQDAYPVNPIEGAVTMEFKPKVGTILKYKSSMKGEAVMQSPNGLGEQTLGLDIAYAMAVTIGKPLKNDPTKSAISVVNEILKYSVGGTDSVHGTEVKSGYEADVDTLGRVRNFVSNKEKMTSLQMRMGAFVDQKSHWYDLPDHPVQVGDSWSSEYLLNPVFSAKPMYYTLRLQGQTVVKGRKAYVCSVTGANRVDLDFTQVLSEQDRQQGLKMLTIKGTIEDVGTTYIDQETGVTLLTISKAKDDEVTKISEDIEVLMKSKSTFTTELVSDLKS